MSLCLHATAVDWHGRGVLIRGPSGSGKSMLAQALIERGALLVSDDQVLLTAEPGTLVMTAPAALAGLLELRGVGLIRIPYVLAARLALVVDLVPLARVERLPDLATIALLDRRFPVLPVAGTEPLAPLRVTAALRAMPEN